MVDIAADVPRMVRGDGLRLRQILLKLLGNAAKFTLTGQVTLNAGAIEQADGSRLLTIGLPLHGVSVRWGIPSSELPIVALTANAYAEDVAASLASGMQAHIAKPVTMAELDQGLQRWGAVRSGSTSLLGTMPAAGRVGERYHQRKRETLAAVDAMVRHGEFAQDELASVAALLHKLAGTAAMFGEAELGDRAREFEAGLGDWPTGERTARIVSAAHVLRNAA